MAHLFESDINLPFPPSPPKCIQLIRNADEKKDVSVSDHTSSEESLKITLNKTNFANLMLWNMAIVQMNAIATTEKNAWHFNRAAVSSIEVLQNNQ